MHVFDWKHFHNVLWSYPMFRCMFLTGNILHKVLRSYPMFRILFLYWKHIHNMLYNQGSDPLFRCLFCIGNIFIMCCIISDRILCLDVCFRWEYYKMFPTFDFLLIWNRPIACDWSIWLYGAWMYKYAWEGCRL